MRIVKIDTLSDCSSLYSNDMWKEFAWEEEDFDNRFVIAGNREFSSCEKAEWYEKSKKLADAFCESEDYEDNSNVCTRFEWEKAYKAHNTYVHAAYRRKEGYDLLSDVLGIARALYPDEIFEKYKISGSCQGEWQYVIFRETGIDEPQKAIHTLEAFYFGSVAQIRSAGSFGEGDYVNYVTLDSFWEAEYNDRIEEFVRQIMADVLEDGEKIEIYVSDGEVRQRKWKKIHEETSDGDPDEKRYVVIGTVERDSGLLTDPDGKSLMTLQQAMDILKTAFEEDCRNHGYDPDEYTKFGYEDDDAGFSRNGTSAYTNFRDNTDWNIVEVK